MASKVDERGMLFFRFACKTQIKKVIFMAFCIFEIQVFLKSRIAGTDL